MTEDEAMARYDKLVLDAIVTLGRHDDNEKHPKVIVAMRRVKTMNGYIRKHFPEGGLVKEPDKAFANWLEENAD